MQGLNARKSAKKFLTIGAILGFAVLSSGCGKKKNNDNVNRNTDGISNPGYPGGYGPGQCVPLNSGPISFQGPALVTSTNISGGRIPSGASTGQLYVGVGGGFQGGGQSYQPKSNVGGGQLILSVSNGYGGQIQGQYPGQYPNQYPGQYPNQYPGQYGGGQSQISGSVVISPTLLNLIMTQNGSYYQNNTFGFNNPGYPQQQPYPGQYPNSGYGGVGPCVSEVAIEAVHNPYNRTILQAYVFIYMNSSAHGYRLEYL